MKPTTKVFTKDKPCNKFDIWSCFYGADGFLTVQVDHVHSVIGENVPRGLERESRLELVESKQMEYYRLTKDGEEWLLKGFRNYLANHPSAWHLVTHTPEDWKRPAKVAKSSRIHRK